MADEETKTDETIETSEEKTEAIKVEEPKEEIKVEEKPEPKPAETKAEEKPAPSGKFKDVIEKIEKLTVLELSELVKEDEGLGIIINSFQVRGTKIGRIEIISGGLVDADMEDLPALYMVYILPRSRESQPSEERRTADVETVSLVESYPVFGHRRRAEINPPPMH